MTEPVFVIGLDGLQYFTRNWTISVSENRLHLHGDFVTIDGGLWATELYQQAGMSFSVKLGGQRDNELMQEAEDKQRVKKLSDHLIGLTEKFIETNLSHEFKEILKRTPTTVTEMGDLMVKGLNKALNKLGKG